MVKVKLWGGLREFADGASEFDLDAKTLQDVVDRLGTEFPALRPKLAENVSIAVDGQIYRDSLFVPLQPDAEIFLLPRLAGG